MCEANGDIRKTPDRIEEQKASCDRSMSVHLAHCVYSYLLDLRLHSISYVIEDIAGILEEVFVVGILQ